MANNYEVKLAFERLEQAGKKSPEMWENLSNCISHSIREEYQKMKGLGFDALWERYIDLAAITVRTIEELNQLEEFGPVKSA